MSAASNSQNPLDAILAAYLEAVERGETPDRGQLMFEHPNLALELGEFFADLDHVQNAAAPLRLAAQMDETIIPSANTVSTPSSPPKIIYFGEYELLEEIARGGMGVVYKARQTTLNRIVALKMVLKGSLATPVDVARFRAEAEAAAQLNHRHIAPIYEVGEHDGLQYFTMQYIEGPALSRVPCESPRDEVIRLKEVAEAVHYAHQHGILHRDLKPGNILIDIDDVPYVVDFGLAKRLDDADLSLTETNQVIGTPRYMAPEQAAGSKSLTIAADVYALGTILFERLTGAPLFPGNNYVEVLDSVRAGADRVRLSAVSHSVGRDLHTILQKCLYPEPSRRYSSCQQLADEFDRWLNGVPILSRPVSNAEQSWRWMRRNPVISGLSVAAVLLLCLTTTILTVAYYQVSRLSGEKDLSIVREKKALLDAKAQTAIALAQTAIAKDQAKAAQIAWAEGEVERKRANARELESRQRRYDSDMSLIQSAWETGKEGRALQLLEQHGPESFTADLRGFEWFFWDRLCHRELLAVKASANALAFSPDGARIASSGFKSVNLRDAASGEITTQFSLLKDSVTYVAFSADGKRIGAACEDQTVRLWDAVTGSETATLNGHTNQVRAIAFSPVGDRLASASNDHTIKVWDLNTNQAVLTLAGHTATVTAVAYRADGRQIASASQDQTVKVWDAIVGTELGTLRGHSGGVRSVDFHPDGSHLTSCGDDRSVKVWDAVTRAELRTLTGHDKFVHVVRYSPDGRRIASSSDDHTVKLWDAVTGQLTATLKGHTAGVESLAFSPDGTRIATTDYYHGGQTKIWDLEVAYDTTTLKGHTAGVNWVTFSPDGTWLASASEDHTVKLWDTATARESATLRGHTGPVSCVAFSPDGASIVSGSHDHTIVLWRHSNSATLTGHSAEVRCVAFSPDGTLIASASDDQTVKLWDTAKAREIRTLSGHSGAVLCLAFNSDGTRIASASYDNTVKMWDTSTGIPVDAPSRHQRPVISVAFSRDGKRFASASHDKTIKLFDEPLLRETWTLRGQIEPAFGLAFSPDGKRLATASADHTVKLWDTATGQETMTLNGHTAEVHSVAFSPDGRRLATASWDNTVKLWDARPVTTNLPRLTELAARSVVAFHRRNAALMDDVVAAIVADTTLTEPIRQAAIDSVKLPVRSVIIPNPPVFAAPPPPPPLECTVATNLMDKKFSTRQQLIYVTAQSKLKVLRFDGQPAVEFALTESIPQPVKSIGWRPDKQSIYVLSQDHFLNLSAMPDANVVELHQFPEHAWEATIHPSEDRIAWIRMPDGKSPEVIVSKSDGSEATNLGFGYDPVWTADGQNLIYTSSDRGEWCIAVRSGANTGILRVPAHPKACLYPNPSPDGRQVAFAMKGENGTMQIGLVSIDGGNLRQLTHEGNENSHPQFSPDGRYVAFTRSLKTPCCMIIVDTATGVETIVANDAQSTRPVWHAVAGPP